MKTKRQQPVLCYVEGNWAYFTTQPLKDQWGDDWNDAPYEHNAGQPNEYGDHDAKDGIEPWSIIKVAWDGPFEKPYEWCGSRSVEEINKGQVPWLRSSPWRSKEMPEVTIHAGITLCRFKKEIRRGGGNVYFKK